MHFCPSEHILNSKTRTCRQWNEKPMVHCMNCYHDLPAICEHCMRLSIPNNVIHIRSGNSFDIQNRTPGTDVRFYRIYYSFHRLHRINCCCHSCSSFFIDLFRSIVTFLLAPKRKLANLFDNPQLHTSFLPPSTQAEFPMFFRWLL